MCERVDTGFHRVSGIHLGLSEHLMVILGMPSYPQCNHTPFYTGGNKGPDAQMPVSYSKLSFLVRPMPVHSSLTLSMPFYDIEANS